MSPNLLTLRSVQHLIAQHPDAADSDLDIVARLKREVIRRHKAGI